LPLILSELADQPQDTDDFTFSSPVYRALTSVRTRGRAENPHRPTFNMAGSFRPDDVVVEGKAGQTEVTLKQTYLFALPLDSLLRGQLGLL
jgi:hypothetical protein